MSTEVSFYITVAPGITCGFSRLENKRPIWLQLCLDEKGSSRFDDYRMPVVFLDGDMAHDVCGTKQLHEHFMLAQALGTAPEPIKERWPIFHNEADKFILSQVWHDCYDVDKPDFLDKFLNAREMRLRLYFADYTQGDFDVPPNQLKELQAKVQAQFCC